MDHQQRVERSARGRQLAETLAEHEVAAVAVTFVDTSGVTRVKGVPVAAFEQAAAWGVGATPVFDAFGADDSIAPTPIANPAGDLRLLPDLDRVVPLAGQPGWAWSPADRWTLDGEPHSGCARLLAARMMRRLTDAGFQARSAFEVEWVVYRDTEPNPRPAATGPAYGMARLAELSDYSVELLRALAAQGVAVRQFHPEYSPSQFELSVAAEPPVVSADTAVLVRATIRAVAARHGLAVSFAPAVFDPGVGNGGHLHISLSRDGQNLFAGGERWFGLTEEAEAFTAGVLARLPGLLAVGAPSVASYLRLLPSHWAGVFGCWGLENREAAIRLVTGSIGERDSAANIEIKCFDQSANPYLAVAAVLATGLAGIAGRASLPDPVQVDPAALSDLERSRLGIDRLPTQLTDAVRAFAAEPVLTEAFGAELTETLVAVREAEIDRFVEADPAEIIAATPLAVLMVAWIDKLPLVDHHCHSVFRGELDVTGFGALLTEGPGPAPGADPFDSMLGLAVCRECAPVLDLPAHAPPADYLARRAELGSAEVNRRLFAATGTRALLVDHGFRNTDLLGLDKLAEFAGAPVAEVLRLEAVAEQVAERVRAADFPDALAAEVARRAETAVGCKSILAYRFGLDVVPRRPAPAEVAMAAARWFGRVGHPSGRLTDPVLLRHALWCGVDTGLPLQLHTGFGDPDEDLHRANPALLTAFCRATEDTGTPIVLLHCYPYHREAAWLAQVFQHVYVDIGLASTYVGFRAAELLAEVLELAPFGKLLYSSDAFGLAELYLVAARAFRRSVREVLGGWGRTGEAAEADVRRIATMISGENARRLYRLST